MKVEGVTGIRPATRIENNHVNRENEAGKTEKVETNTRKTNTQVKEEEREKASLREHELIQTIERANAVLKGVDKRFEFSIHEGTKEIMVKVIDDATNEVIREIPPEKILDMVAKMWELVGILVDRKI